MPTPSPLVFLLLAATALPAAAHPRDAEIDAREARQPVRIESGVASGALTPREFIRLASEQRAIHRDERMLRSDGGLTPRERALLAHEQNAASRDIARQKHDAQRSF